MAAQLNRTEQPDPVGKVPVELADINSNGCVAQLNRAFDYESKGFWFESRRGH